MPLVGVASLFLEGVMRERKIGIKEWHCWGDKQVCMTLWQCVSLRADVRNCWSWLSEALACWSQEHVIPFLWNFKEQYKKKQMFFSSATNITWLSVWLLEMSHVDWAKLRNEAGQGKEEGKTVLRLWWQVLAQSKTEVFCTFLDVLNTWYLSILIGRTTFW